MTNGVVWWEIESADPVGTQAFYGAMFGWTFARAFDGPQSELGREYWLVQSGGRGIGGLQTALSGAATPQAGVRLYVEVDNLEAALDAAKQLGAEVERGEHPLLGTR
jgi:predicted enzyme related to lactoylglutathione lyase